MTFKPVSSPDPDELEQRHLPAGPAVAFASVYVGNCGMYAFNHATNRHWHHGLLGHKRDGWVWRPRHPLRLGSRPPCSQPVAECERGTRMSRAHRGMFWPLCLQCSFQKSADQPSRLSLVVWDLAPSNAWDLFAASGAFEATVEVVKRALLLPPPANPTTH